MRGGGGVQPPWQLRGPQELHHPLRLLGQRRELAVQLRRLRAALLGRVVGRAGDDGPDGAGFAGNGDSGTLLARLADANPH